MANDRNIKSRIAAVMLGFVFLLVIYAVPVVQSVVEVKQGGSIQAFDLLVDAAATPFRNAKDQHALAKKLVAYCDTAAALINSNIALSAEREKIERIAEEMLYTAEDIRKGSFRKNRHVKADSLLKATLRLDTLSALCSEIFADLRNGSPAEDFPARFSAVRDRCASILKEYPQPKLIELPLLALRNIPFILWNDRYLRPYEKEMENSSVFALSLRPKMFMASFLVFKDLGEKGLLGRNGWFFYKQDVDFLVKPYILDPRSVVVDPNDRPVSDNPVEAILKFRDQLGARGIDLLLVIVPGKPSIYPDLVSSRMRPSLAGTFSHSIRMISELEKQGVDVVNLFAPFSQERLRDKEEGDSLYLHEDTHWKARGVRLAARTVADRVRKYQWFSAGSAEYMLDSISIDRTGDIGTMSTLPLNKVRGRYGLFQPETTKCYKVLRILRDRQGNETGRKPYKDEFRKSDILVLGDSFSRIYQTDEPRSAGWISHLAFELAQPVASLVNDGGSSTLVRQSLARKPNLLKGKKLVIWEIVERDFRFGEDGWKEVPLERE